MAEFNYTECGLDNVVISGIDIVTDHAGEETFQIPNIIGLHKVIAASIIKQPHGMSPNELRFLRTEMGETQAQLAELVNKDQQTVGRWERGECPIETNIETIIRLHAAEVLGIQVDMPIADLVKNCIPRAEFSVIQIDGSDPTHYKTAA
ncbi:helix-turn-helix transcriptional regulator [Emcibacter sp.]|uniref:helix-turn-helix transcriptional regulator n=1 Tax=Emcibacter sp. TaxID=1979954 RepID=UPI003A924972